mmetsp:Transcript_13065/g.38416  ORF Transcript_13065/g.38416 Transcript_13065/m.38416 type:complete len:205 (-) Transcript_13065:167-781(-)
MRSAYVVTVKEDDSLSSLFEVTEKFDRALALALPPPPGLDFEFEFEFEIQPRRRRKRKRERPIELLGHLEQRRQRIVLLHRDDVRRAHRSAELSLRIVVGRVYDSQRRRRRHCRSDYGNERRRRSRRSLLRERQRSDALLDTFGSRPPGRARPRRYGGIDRTPNSTMGGCGRAIQTGRAVRFRQQRRGRWHAQIPPKDHARDED